MSHPRSIKIDLRRADGHLVRSFATRRLVFVNTLGQTCANLYGQERVLTQDQMGNLSCAIDADHKYGKQGSGHIVDLRRTPIRKLCGRRVKLLFDLETRGGAQFPKGSEMIITGKYNGLSLRNPGSTHADVTRVAYWKVELVEENDNGRA